MRLDRCSQALALGTGVACRPSNRWGLAAAARKGVAHMCR